HRRRWRPYRHQYLHLSRPEALARHLHSPRRDCPAGRSLILIVMQYPDGLSISVGDLIWWNERTCVGYVHAVLEANDEYLAWGLDVPGIMLAIGHPFDPDEATVFYPAWSFEDEAVGLFTADEREELSEAAERAEAKSHFGFEG